MKAPIKAHYSDLLQNFSAEPTPRGGRKHKNTTSCCFFLLLFPCLRTDEGFWLDRKSPIILDGLHNLIFYGILLRILAHTHTHKNTRCQHNKGQAEAPGIGSGVLLLQPQTTTARLSFLVGAAEICDGQIKTRGEHKHDLPAQSTRSQSGATSGTCFFLSVSLRSKKQKTKTGSAAQELCVIYGMLYTFLRCYLSSEGQSHASRRRCRKKRRGETCLTQSSTAANQLP